MAQVGRTANKALVDTVPFVATLEEKADQAAEASCVSILRGGGYAPTTEVAAKMCRGKPLTP